MAVRCGRALALVKITLIDRATARSVGFRAAVEPACRATSTAPGRRAAGGAQSYTRSADSSVFTINMVMVMGPTPPGTGVM